MNGYLQPCYNRDEMIKKTKQAPLWVHFGYGNIFRAFQARAMQSLLNQGLADRGIIAAELYDEEIVTRVMEKCDDLTICVTFMGDGSIEKELVASVAESLTYNQLERLEEVFSSDSLELVTFTITEKGYSPTLDENSYMGKVARLLYKRYKNNKKPIAMVSMDNCSKNGDKLKSAMKLFAEKWGDEGFSEYLEKVTFPWTMIDKITPRPSEEVMEILKADGFGNTEITITDKKTYVAPFVNGEECEYLIIEDDFPVGRPPLEKCGVIFTTREQVEKCERLKVTAALNPLHTALAVLGCVLGYKKISDEMNDKSLYRLVYGIAEEGLKVVERPDVLNAEDFVLDVLTKRLPNPNLPDTPQRIATDTSQKVSIRFGETIKAYGKRAKDLKYIPFALAGWLRYLDATDDNGDHFELSPDPLLDELKCADKDELLKRTDIFGADLYSLGVASKVLDIYKKMKKNTVRKTLEEYMEEENERIS